MDGKHNKGERKKRSKSKDSNKFESKQTDRIVVDEDINESQYSESPNQLVAAENSTDEKFDINAKEKWMKYKSQIQGLNKLLEGSLYKMKAGIEVERSNTQLIELWQEATGRCESMEREIERFRNNEVYKEQLKIVKTELSKMFAENYEVTKNNHDLRMKMAELLVQIETLERKLKLVTIQLEEMNDIKSIQIEELKREVQSSKVVIRSLETENKRNVEMATGLEREIATYKMLLGKLTQNQALLERKEQLAIEVTSGGYSIEVVKSNEDEGKISSGVQRKGIIALQDGSSEDTQSQTEEEDYGY